MWYNLFNSAQTAQEKRKGYSMKIVLVGGGKVGTALARQLSEEGHNVTVIDTNKARVEHIGESYDVMSILGNGSSITTLSEAGVEEADVFIAVTGSDELNLLCCMFAKKAGHCHAIARVRNPSYSHELDFIKKQIGISAIINPEMAAAKEISHLLRFPGASKIDTFADGRVRLIKFALTERQGLDGVAIHEIPTRLKSDILVCAVERDGGVIIPNGNFVLQNGDQVTFLATQENAHAFFRQIHMPVRPVRNALIVGGGGILSPFFPLGMTLWVPILGIFIVLIPVILLIYVLMCLIASRKPGGTAVLVIFLLWLASFIACACIAIREDVGDRFRAKRNVIEQVLNTEVVIDNDTTTVQKLLKEYESQNVIEDGHKTLHISIPNKSIDITIDKDKAGLEVKADGKRVKVGKSRKASAEEAGQSTQAAAEADADTAAQEQQTE